MRETERELYFFYMLVALFDQVHIVRERAIDSRTFPLTECRCAHTGRLFTVVVVLISKCIERGAFMAHGFIIFSTGRLAGHQATNQAKGVERDGGL